MVGDLLLIASLAMLAVNAILSIVLYFQGSSGGEGDIPPSALWLTVIGNALIFLALPVAWVASTVEGGWAGMRKFLGLHGGVGEAGIGVGVGAVMVMVIGGIAFLLDQLGLAPESAPIEDLLKNVTWPLAIAFSLVAGFGEEVLFRGILQRWLQWWGQGILFGALHIANAGWFAFAIVGLIGLGFGYARRRGVSLWTLIVAHVVYDFILLAMVLLFPEEALSGGAA